MRSPALWDDALRSSRGISLWEGRIFWERANPFSLSLEIARRDFDAFALLSFRVRFGVLTALSLSLSLSLSRFHYFFFICFIDRRCASFRPSRARLLLSRQRRRHRARELPRVRLGPGRQENDGYVWRAFVFGYDWCRGEGWVD